MDPQTAAYCSRSVVKNTSGFSERQGFIEPFIPLKDLPPVRLVSSLQWLSVRRLTGERIPLRVQAYGPRSVTVAGLQDEQWRKYVINRN